MKEKLKTVGEHILGLIAIALLIWLVSMSRGVDSISSQEEEMNPFVTHEEVTEYVCNPFVAGSPCEIK